MRAFPKFFRSAYFVKKADSRILIYLRRKTVPIARILPAVSYANPDTGPDQI